jgi:hypothetical protein
MVSLLPKLFKVDHFKLQLFIPLCAKLGLIRKERLICADWSTAAKNINNGSYDYMKELNIPADRHQQTYFDICSYVSVRESESLGESICCEANRKQMRYDLFYRGQHLYHLMYNFITKEYHIGVKRFGEVEWKVFLPLVY